MRVCNELPYEPPHNTYWLGNVLETRVHKVVVQSAERDRGFALSRTASPAALFDL